SLTGSSSIANYQTVLRSVTYNNTSGGPGTSSKTANVVVNDGTTDSNTAVATINLPPVVALTVGAGAPNFTTGWYNSGAVPIENMAQATVTFPAGVANLTQLKVALDTFHTGDVLSLGQILPGVVITATYSAGTLTLSGSDTVANYQKELKFIAYNN